MTAFQLTILQLLPILYKSTSSNTKKKKVKTKIFCKSRVMVEILQCFNTKENGFGAVSKLESHDLRSINFGIRRYKLSSSL